MPVDTYFRTKRSCGHKFSIGNAYAIILFPQYSKDKRSAT